MPRRLDLAQSLERLGKYAGGDDWRERRHAHVEAMLGRLLTRYGLELRACFDEVAAFGPEAANVIDEFLARRGWQQSPRAREYIKGIRATPASLYEVQQTAYDFTWMWEELGLRPDG